MCKLSMLFNKNIFLVIVLAVALTATPLTNVYASGLGVPDEPPAGESLTTTERLEQIWSRLLNAYERQGQLLERADTMVDRFQEIIDRMEANGKDASDLQVALDTFSEGLKEAHPIYESAKGIINSHKGFDSGGKVTDEELAIETIRDLRAKIKEIRAIVGEPGRALRQAIKAYREARRPAEMNDS